MCAWAEIGSQAAFAGENFTRGSGSVTDVQKLQLFAWQSEQRGHDVHVNAHPTQGELLHREFLKNKDKLKDTSKVSILDRYGGEQHLERVPRELLDGQTESYVEYSRSGKVIKGQERAVAKSKYDEDVFPGNHKSVWGSWYDKTEGKWGFRCCHSTTKASYCTGEAGRLAIESGPISSSSASANGGAKTLLEQMQERINAKAAEEAVRLKGSARKRREASTDVVEEEDEPDSREDRERQRESASRLRKDRDDPRGVGQLDASKVEEARRMEKRRRVMDDDELAKAGKDKYGVTEEEVEAYRREREMGEDPMARIRGDELLPL